MVIRDKQFVAFNDGQEVEVPEDVEMHKAVDVSYSVEKNAPDQATQTIVDSQDVQTEEQAEATADSSGFVLKEMPQDEHDNCSGNVNPEYARPSSQPRMKQQTKKEASFVTRKFMIICMIIAIIVSTGLGAGIALSLGTNSSNKKHSNLSESSLAAATGSKLTVSQIIAKNADAVVEIVTESTSMGFWGQQQLSEGAGSGVIVNKDGYIVTNYHVIEGANSVKVTLHNGDEYPATVVGGENAIDVAVLKISAKDLTPAVLGDSDAIAVGDIAVAIGNPLGSLGGTATAGIISALDRQLTIDGRTLNLLQTDAAINLGNSGGGLFNGAGELIGIVDAKTSAAGVEGLAFAIPINTLKDDIDSLINNGKVSSKPSIGITIYDVSDENAAMYELEGAGVYIAEVTGKAAQQAGFKEKDRIVSFNGEKIKGSEDLITKVRKCKVGDTVEVVVSRDGQNITIKTKLEESVVTN